MTRIEYQLISVETGDVLLAFSTYEEAEQSVIKCCLETKGVYIRKVFLSN